MLAVLCIGGCGGEQTAAAPWRAAHPDPVEASFEATAPGLCALTPRYPDEAPAAIDYMDDRYVQELKAGRTAAPPGTRIATSGDWTLSRAGSTLYLLTPGGLFTYQKTEGC
jgi:hypothetical protein